MCFPLTRDQRKKEYLGRLESWQMSKNLKKDDWKLVHNRSSAKKRTQVLLNDREINPKRVKRAQGRHKFNVEPSSQSSTSWSCTFNNQSLTVSKLDQTPRVLEVLRYAHLLLLLVFKSPSPTSHGSNFRMPMSLMVSLCILEYLSLPLIIHSTVHGTHSYSKFRLGQLVRFATSPPFAW